LTSARKKSLGESNGQQFVVPNNEDTDETVYEMSDEEVTLTMDWEEKENTSPVALKWRGNEIIEFAESLATKPRVPPGRDLSRLATLNFLASTVTDPIWFAVISTAQSPPQVQPQAQVQPAQQVI
jgi:hypothetical protein